MSLRARMLYEHIKRNVPCRVSLSFNTSLAIAYNIEDVIMKEDFNDILYLKLRHIACHYPIHEKYVLEVLLDETED